MILGCDEPMVLRATGVGTYEAVGRTFLQRFQYAEGLLGAVPDGYDHVWAYSEEMHSDIIAWVDRESGKVQYEDPRLADWPLPQGRRDLRQDGAPNGVYFNDQTGEATGEFDPRLRYDELVKRGVPMQKFVLV